MINSSSKLSGSFEAHYASLTKFAYLLTGKMDVARELVHDAMLNAAGGNFDPDDSAAGAYLRTVVSNLWKRRLRRFAMETRSILRLASQDRTGLEMAAEVDDRVVIWSALLSLPYGWRLCIVLRYYEDWPLAQIAHQLRLPLGTVKSRIHKGLRRLEKALGPTL